MHYFQYVVDKLLMKNPVVKAAFCGVTSLRASRGRITLDGTDRVLPPMPADPHLTGSVAVSGIFTVSTQNLYWLASALLTWDALMLNIRLSSSPLQYVYSFTIQVICGVNQFQVWNEFCLCRYCTFMEKMSNSFEHTPDERQWGFACDRKQW